MIAIYAFDNKMSTFEISMETSLDVWKFTPRWNIESYPGNQVFLFNKVRCSYFLFSIGRASTGVESGFANRFHFTHFYSYNSWGLTDSRVWLILEDIGTVSIMSRCGIPTGNYREGLGNGAYSIEFYLKKKGFMRISNVYTGYEWIGKNPDKVNCGDRIHFALDINRWLRMTTYYTFADHGEYFPLFDSPSFSLGVSIFKDFSFINAYRVKLIFNQTLLGRDTEMTSSIALKISKRKETTNLQK